LIISKLALAQSVTIVPTDPAIPEKGTVVFDNASNFLKYHNGTTWVNLENRPANVWTTTIANDIFNENTGNVGIGLSNPSEKLMVFTFSNNFGLTHSDGAVTMGTWIGDYLGATGGWIGTKSEHPLNFFTNNGAAKMTLSTNGNFGIGSVSPANKLQIGSVGATGFAGNDLAIGNGTHATGFYQTNASFTLGSTTDIIIRPRNNNNGYVGINTPSAPVNSLQIGSMGATGFAGNNLALGNGTHALAIFQSNIATTFAATTDIILKPRNNLAGRVGINTSTPRASLEVAGSDIVLSPTGQFAYYSIAYSATFPVGYYANYGIGSFLNFPDVSIYASNRIMASEFNAFSDARIKDIIGISNSTKDLETLKALQITDYMMKDKIIKGNKSFKKVIAQQVEKVYPQAVSLSTSVVPDIYSLAEKVVYDETNKTLTVSLCGTPPAKSYDIKIGEKIEFVHEKEGKIKAEVIEVSGNSFIVKDWKYETDKIFVYGREVNDFRTVDYEAISMLGISAIQELAKEIEKLKSQNSKLKADFSARLEALETLLLKPQNGK
jgi:Chaperone of endosialidase